VPTVPHDDDEIVCLVYAPAAETSTHVPIRFSDVDAPGSVEPVPPVKRPIQVFAGPVPPFGNPA